MENVSEFQVGTSYTNDQVRFALRVGNLGGIRPSVDDRGNLRHIAIMSSTDIGRQSDYRNPYSDRIEGDILTYFEYIASPKRCRLVTHLRFRVHSCLRTLVLVRQSWK